MVRATHLINMDKMDSQAVLGSDDEMDDIINEFAKTENDVVNLSDESSADEMDSLLDEFANNLSDSDADEKKFDPKVVLSSDDDIEMDDLLEEFREENVQDTSSLLNIKNDPTCADKRESSSIVFDTDNRNGTIFNNTFEILFSEDSGDKSCDENAFNSTAKKSCVSSPKLQEFKICANLKQERLDETEKCNFSHDIKKHNSESVLDSKTVSSSEAVSINQSCKKEFNGDILEEEKSCDKEPPLNNDSNLCNNSEISINKTNFDAVNLCENNTTELSQETEPSFSLKISSVSSVKSCEASDTTVIEDSKQNLIDNLGLKDNESNLNTIQSLVHSLGDSATNAEEVSTPFENGSNLTKENMDLCQTNEKMTKCEKQFSDVSCNGMPISREGSREAKCGQAHSEPQLEFRNPITSSNHPTFINFPGKENMLVVQEEIYRPTSLATISSRTISSVPCRVTNQMLEPSETSVLLKNYLEYKKAKQPFDHLTKYFQSVEETVRTFPAHLQIEAKSQISALMSHLEYKAFFLTNQNVHPPLYQYSQAQHYPPPHRVEHSNNPFLQSSEIYAYSGMDYPTPPNV